MASTGRRRASWRSVALAACIFELVPSSGIAQGTARLSILQAEDRRAPTAQDVAVIRAGARSGDAQTARIGLRALGRLERPALIPNILPGLRHTLPEVRAEAANAIAQAAQGLRRGLTAPVPLSSVEAALITRLGVEADPTVRAALCEAIARLPYTAAADAARAESALVEFAPRASTNTDRLGLAKGFEALTRLQRDVSPVGQPTIDELKLLSRNGTVRPEQELLRDARVRRLAIESLITIDAADAAVVNGAASDPDPQVRRLAVRAATMDGTDAVIARGLNDPAPMVRVEALRAARRQNARDACSPSLAAASDPDMNVAIVAIDQLGGCGDDGGAVSYLVHAVSDVADAEAPRNWHRAAHALVALAAAAPPLATSALPPFAGAHAWQLRVYVARAAGLLGTRAILDQLVRDSDDNVVEAAVVALSASVGHEADDSSTSKRCRVRDTR